MNERELREQSQQFLRDLQRGGAAGRLDRHPGDRPGRRCARCWSTSPTPAPRRASRPPETATFVFSLKQPLFTRLRQAHGPDADGLADDIWQATVLLDTLGLYTAEMYQQRREAIIARQQEELLELSTPVVQLWDGVLALPLIGTLDSARTQMVMENLLQRIVDTRSAIAIIDITGVPLVDTLVAQHLLKTVAAARLMGAECLISGIRPQIAQTIVHLGVILGDVTTKATLADALAVALQKTGQRPPEKLGSSEAGWAGNRAMGGPAVDRIPILQMDEVLLVTIQVDMHDQLALTLQDELTAHIVKARARGVLIDISSLEIVDSFIGRVLSTIAAMARVLDAETVVVGMQPAVAITLVELGLSLTGVRTALNVEKGMAFLRATSRTEGMRR